MIGTQIVIEGSVLQHVVDGCENGGGDRADCLLRSAPSLQPKELSLEIARLLAFCRPCALHQRCLEPWCALTQAVRSAFSCALVVARTQACPSQEMSGCGEAAHIQTDFRDNHLGANCAYTWDAAEEFDGGPKGREVGLDLLIDHCNSRFQAIDLSEMELQQKTMMGGYPSAQGFLQCGLRGFYASMRKRRETNWICLASGHCVEHCPTTLAEHVREFRLELDVGVFERLVNALDMTGSLADQLLARAQQRAHFLRLAIRNNASPQEAMRQQF